MKKTPAAEQFAALGIPESDWTPAMRIAVKQRWSDLRVDAKVADLRADLAAVTVTEVADLAAIRATFLADGRDALAETFDADLVAEQRRLKRNASVNAWRARGQLQAALDARDLKFAALRAKRGKTAAPRPGTETGDPAPTAVDASSELVSA